MRKLLTHRRGSTSKEVFWKYLGSYVCIALLPMIMNSVLSYTLIRDYLTGQVDQNRTEAISYTEHMLDQQISSLVSIASEMSMKSCFTIETESSIGNFYDITDYLMSNKAKTSLFMIFCMQIFPVNRFTQPAACIPKRISPTTCMRIPERTFFAPWRALVPVNFPCSLWKPLPNTAVRFRS